MQQEVIKKMFYIICDRSVAVEISLMALASLRNRIYFRIHEVYFAVSSSGGENYLVE